MILDAIALASLARHEPGWLRKLQWTKCQGKKETTVDFSVLNVNVKSRNSVCSSSLENMTDRGTILLGFLQWTFWLALNRN